jgi:hypothetical protein
MNNGILLSGNSSLWPFFVNGNLPFAFLQGLQVGSSGFIYATLWDAENPIFEQIA